MTSSPPNLANMLALSPAARKPNPFNELINSRLFTFLVGPEKKQFNVHAAAIANMSRELNRLVNGEYAEAQMNVVEWEDMDEDTFVRFSQFAYTGNYHPPHSELLEGDVGSETDGSDHQRNGALVEADPPFPAEEAPLAEDTPAAEAPAEEAPAEEVYAEESFWGQPSKKNKKSRSGFEWPMQPSKQARVRKAFETRNYPLIQHTQVMLDACQPASNEDTNESYVPVFLGHAQLYVLAEKYNVVSLRMLALNKLHRTLLIFKLYSKRVCDIIELIKYAYSDENTMDKEGELDELRGLVLHYVGYEMDIICDTEEFYALLDEGGAFVRNFWSMVYKERLYIGCYRLTGTHQDCRRLERRIAN